MLLQITFFQKRVMEKKKRERLIADNAVIQNWTDIHSYALLCMEVKE